MGGRLISSRVPPRRSIETAGAPLPRAVSRHSHRTQVPSMMRRKTLAALITACFPALSARAQSPVPEPSAYLGFAVGADRMLADWTQIHSYFSALAAASPVVQLDTLGPTTQGLPYLLVTISSEENLRKVAELRRVQA